MERINTDKPTDFCVSEVQTIVMAFFMFPFLVGTFYGAVFYEPLTANATMGKFLSWFGLVACILFYYYLWKAGKFHNKPLLTISKSGIYIEQYQETFYWQDIDEVNVFDTSGYRSGVTGHTTIVFTGKNGHTTKATLPYIRLNPQKLTEVINIYQNAHKGIA